jgi:GcrA cell cycle regulator
MSGHEKHRERNDRILTRWVNGESAGMIAKAFVGLSRSAVMGVVHRARRAGRCERDGGPTKSLPRPRAFRTYAPRVKKEAPAMKERVRVAPGAAPSLNLSLSDLGRGQCKWATTPHDSAAHRFCGHPATPGKPYCEPHARLSVSQSSAKIRSRYDAARVGGAG